MIHQVLATFFQKALRGRGASPAAMLLAVVALLILLAALLAPLLFSD
ncbi:hypothetical protein [Desulfocurvus vexinensis]|nr:hypothetical protein [Desulfocurvus vexinensis]